MIQTLREIVNGYAEKIHYIGEALNKKVQCPPYEQQTKGGK